VLTFLRWLVSEGDLPAAPRVKLLRSPRVSLTPAEVLRSDALAGITAGAQVIGRGRSEFEAVRDVAIVSLLQDSGLRASECAGLLVASIDLPARQALVHAEIAKAGYQRTVCFGSQTARALARYLRLRAPHEFAWCAELFIGRRGPATYHLISGAVRKAGTRGGVAGARAHRFRHTWAHNLKSAGADTEVLMSLGGWRSPAMVARYGRSAATERAIDAYRRKGSPVARRALGARAR